MLKKYCLIDIFKNNRSSSDSRPYQVRFEVLIILSFRRAKVGVMGAVEIPQVNHVQGQNQKKTMKKNSDKPHQPITAQDHLMIL